MLDEFRKHIAASGRNDIVLHQTGCTGRCSREPIVGVIVPGQMPVKYERVDRDAGPRDLHPARPAGPAGAGARARRPDREARPVRDPDLRQRPLRLDRAASRSPRSLAEKLAAAGLSRRAGARHAGQLLRRLQHGRGRASAPTCWSGPTRCSTASQNEADLDEIIREHLMGGQLVERLKVPGKTVGRKFFELYGDVAFFNRQSRIALRHNGVIDPESIEEYFHYRGFQALAKVLEKGDPQVGDRRDHRLEAPRPRRRRLSHRRRNGRWRAEAADKTRYLICNADEGDPGAFMDRSMLEGDPFNVVEGMIIGGFAIGAHRRASSTSAPSTRWPSSGSRTPSSSAASAGLLGKNILGSGFDFDLEIRLGAGAFVCGEETALIHSIEGERGQPRIRPPYPDRERPVGQADGDQQRRDLRQRAGVINYGADWFSQHRHARRAAAPRSSPWPARSRTPAWSKCRWARRSARSSTRSAAAWPAASSSRPSRPAARPAAASPPSGSTLPVDFDTLAKAGSIMGSGGMIVLDEDDCMVDIAKFFMTFSQDESCGKCTPCREGTTRMLEILERITAGKGTLEDLDKLERLARLMKKASLCGLGRAAPNPVLSTLEHFRDEYLAHVTEQRCPAQQVHGADPLRDRRGEVRRLHGLRPQLPGRRASPASAQKPHVIDQVRCIKCGRCFEVCRFDAVEAM